MFRKPSKLGAFTFTATTFIFLTLLGTLYFNSQVQFNPISARWEINEDYQIKDSYVTGTYIETNLYELEFDGVDDYVFLDHNLTGNLSYFEMTVAVDFFAYLLNTDTLNTSNKAVPRIVSYNNPNLVLRDVNNNVIFNQHFSGNSQNFNNYKVTFDGSQYQVTINGNLEGTYNNTTPIDISLIQYLFYTTDLSDSQKVDFRYLRLESDNGGELEYKITDGSGNILTDTYGNNNATIIGNPIFNLYDTEIINTLNTVPAIDSYQVFENIRNNAPTSNPLKFMDTIVGIPAQAVGYFRTITQFYTKDIPEFATDLISDALWPTYDTWWGTLLLDWQLFVYEREDYEE